MWIDMNETGHIVDLHIIGSVAPLAQSVERKTVNLEAAGSIPAWCDHCHFVTLYLLSPTRFFHELEANCRPALRAQQLLLWLTAPSNAKMRTG